MSPEGRQVDQGLQKVYCLAIFILMQTGKIIQIIGPVVDVEFSEPASTQGGEGKLPQLFNALIVRHNDKEIILDR